MLFLSPELIEIFLLMIIMGGIVTFVITPLIAWKISEVILNLTSRLLQRPLQNMPLLQKSLMPLILSSMYIFMLNCNNIMFSIGNMLNANVLNSLYGTFGVDAIQIVGGLLAFATIPIMVGIVFTAMGYAIGRLREHFNLFPALQNSPVINFIDKCSQFLAWTTAALLFVATQPNWWLSESLLSSPTGNAIAHFVFAATSGAMGPIAFFATPLVLAGIIYSVAYGADYTIDKITHRRQQNNNAGNPPLPPLAYNNNVGIAQLLGAAPHQHMNPRPADANPAPQAQQADAKAARQQPNDGSVPIEYVRLFHNEIPVQQRRQPGSAGHHRTPSA